MNILIIGAGGREHALAWKLAQSPQLDRLFIAPGNAGTATLGTNVPIGVEDFEAIKELVLEEGIDLVVVGPEAPLVAGITDFFKADPLLFGVPVIGPSKAGAALEGSKDIAKVFMRECKIPTGEFRTYIDYSVSEGKAYLATLDAPYVLKADGLAAGKGVLIIDDLEEAQQELENMVKGKFGEASRKVVVEEYLSGIELSVFVLTDGEGYVMLPEAKDYKRVGEGDTGLNTGGMGAISPVPFADKAFLQKVEERIVKPTIEGLKDREIDYKGFIFIGLMNKGGDPYVIEYNVRLGDPETEVVLPRVKSDMVELLQATAEGRLSEMEIELDERTVSTVMLVSGGYPGSYEKGMEISGLDQVEGSVVFHAGTKLEKEKVLTNGGRVLAVTSYGKTMQEALAVSYKNAEKIRFDYKYYRKDIGFDL
jgi:phosphoribosylamine---glycine ligase